MARLLRVEYEGAIHHVTIRGNERRALFGDDADRERFLKRLGELVDEYGVRLYLFVLMTNHVHLVLETPKGNLSRFMHNVQTGYTIYYNLRHDRAGHLMQGRFGDKLVDGDEYLLKLSRYVHLNPVWVGSMKRAAIKERIRHLRCYQWSSYPSYIGRRKRLEFVEYGPMLSLMKVKKARRGKEYRKFVESGAAGNDEEFAEALSESRLSIGSEGFRRWIWDKHLAQLEGHRGEDVSFRRQRRKIDTEKILEVTSAEFQVDPEGIERRQRASYVRPVTAKMLCNYGGLTQREAAEILGLRTGAAVSIQLKNLSEALEADRGLRRHVARIEKTLAEVDRVSTRSA
jgi:putative transposase